MISASKLEQTLLLAGDIGGTKTNLAIFRQENGFLELLTAKTYASSDKPTLEEIIRQFLSEVNLSIGQACLGIAGPVINGTVRTTNLPWHIAENDLKNKFGWRKIKLINDLVALGESIPHLKQEQLLEINPAAESTAKGTIGLIAAGTGLGEALLVWHDNSYIPCSSEGGHKDFAPRNELEYRLHRHLVNLFGHVSVERLISGSGLAQIYRFLRDDQTSPEPSWLSEKFAREDAGAVISWAALAGKDKICEEALQLFVSLYGAEAGNLALQGLTKGGIYIGGGIAPKIAGAINSDTFMGAFIGKGRMQHLLEKIPVRLILDPQAALFGAAASLSRDN